MQSKFVVLQALYTSHGFFRVGNIFSGYKNKNPNIKFLYCKIHLYYAHGNMQQYCPH